MRARLAHATLIRLVQRTQPLQTTDSVRDRADSGIQKSGEFGYNRS